ncbi:MAG TPA: hypothetical protein VF195_07990 [Actinomycetota bacterium]
MISAASTTPQNTDCTVGPDLVAQSHEQQIADDDLSGRNILRAPRLGSNGLTGDHLVAPELGDRCRHLVARVFRVTCVLG